MRPTLDAVLASQARHVPLVVDLDGTICRADTLEWLRERCLGGPLALEDGRVLARAESKQAEKVYLWHRVGLPVDELPYDTDVVEAVRAERAAGRDVVLATGSASGLAEAVAGHLGMFTVVMGSDRSRNLTGPRKGEALVQAFGHRGFDYVGDSPADVHVWEVAGDGVLVERPGTPRFPVPGNVTRVELGGDLMPLPAALRVLPHPVSDR